MSTPQMEHVPRPCYGQKSIPRDLRTLCCACRAPLLSAEDEVRQVRQAILPEGDLMCLAVFLQQITAFL